MWESQKIRTAQNAGLLYVSRPGVHHDEHPRRDRVRRGRHDCLRCDAARGREDGGGLDGANPDQARALAEAVAKEAFNNVAFFAGDPAQLRGALAGTRTADK